MRLFEECSQLPMLLGVVSENASNVIVQGGQFADAIVYPRQHYIISGSLAVKKRF